MTSTLGGQVAHKHTIALIGCVTGSRSQNSKLLRMSCVDDPYPNNQPNGRLRLSSGSSRSMTDPNAFFSRELGN